MDPSALRMHLHSHTQCQLVLCRNMESQAHCHSWSWHLDTPMHSTFLSPAGICPHMSTACLAPEKYVYNHGPWAPWPLHAYILTHPMPHSALCMFLHSHACSPSLPSAGICVHTPTASLWCRQVPAFSYIVPTLTIAGTCSDMLLHNSPFSRQLYSIAH